VARVRERSYPPSVWGGGTPPVVHATGATAGIPGTWTPAGSTPPATVAALQAGTPNTVTATPATAWTAGQYVQTATTGAAGRATWSGTGWVGGVGPGTTGTPTGEEPCPPDDAAAKTPAKKAAKS
jgi:hypothetical protein